MSEKVPAQASSKEDLVEQSAFEESMASFGLVDLDSEHSVILRDWCAQDFANIYVRFRPHLISHARRFLREEAHAEEVVQDAFLYLMTALPELDSELGVLRFLKWKTKMLCIDIIRSSQAGLNSRLVTLPDEVVDETQPHDSLERADDAAIIRLALAKLNPRQREALIATMYEEKSHEEVAQQMGVGENAFRQLLFRARASFRQALVGEAEIEGKSVVEILAVAAKKASSARNTVLAVLLVMTSIAVSPMLGNSIQMSEEGDTLVASTPLLPAQVAPEKARSTPYSIDEVPYEKELSAEIASVKKDEVGPADTQVAEVSKPPLSVNADTVRSRDFTEDVKMQQSREAFNEALDVNLVLELAAQGLSVSEENGQLTAFNEIGLTANFAVDLESQSVIQFLVIEFESDGRVWKAVPGNSLSVVEEEDGKTLVSYAATDFLVGDFSGEFDYVSTSESVFSKSGIKLDVVLDGNGELVESSMSLLPRS